MNHCLRFSALLLAVLVSGCASTSPTMQDLYLYQGLKPAEGAHANDGVFQDFYADADTLARIWADPDATLHKGKANAWVQAHVDRSNEVPHLAVKFERAGYGTSVEIAPKNKVPELLPANGVIQFQMMSEEAVCVGVRVSEHDGEVWGYGKAGLNYARQCTKTPGEWETFTLDANPERWFKFIYGGNTNLGNNVFDGRMITMMSFEIGKAADYHIAQGSAQVNIRSIRVDSAQDTQVATR